MPDVDEEGGDVADHLRGEPGAADVLAVLGARRVARAVDHLGDEVRVERVGGRDAAIVVDRR
ncbi:MAG: hypothetical protein ACK559_34605, partial [bacterium]